MKLTFPEQYFIDKLREAGGTWCPEESDHFRSDAWKLMRRLERKGVIDIEQVDTGYRYSLRDGANG